MTDQQVEQFIKTLYEKLQVAMSEKPQGYIADRGTLNFVAKAMIEAAYFTNIITKHEAKIFMAEIFNDS